MVWKLAETGKNQETIAGIMGWSRGQVSQYAMLKEIDTQVWHIIATTFAESGSSEKDDEVAGNATVVAEVSDIIFFCSCRTLPNPSLFAVQNND